MPMPASARPRRTASSSVVVPSVQTMRGQIMGTTRSCGQLLEAGGEHSGGWPRGRARVERLGDERPQARGLERVQSRMAVEVGQRVADELSFPILLGRLALG